MSRECLRQARWWRRSIAGTPLQRRFGRLLRSPRAMNEQQGGMKMPVPRSARSARAEEFKAQDSNDLSIFILAQLRRSCTGFVDIRLAFGWRLRNDSKGTVKSVGGTHWWYLAVGSVRVRQ